MIATKQLYGIKYSHMPDFSDPLALLIHCHEKIERQLQALE